MSGERPTVAVLLSTESFELFFGKRLGMTPEEFAAWEGGWSASYCRMLEAQGMRALQYVPSRERDELIRGATSVRLLGLPRAWAPLERVPLLWRSGPVRYLTQSVNTAALWRRLHRALREDGVDVLMVQEYWTARFDALAARSPVPIVAIDQGFSGRRELKVAKDRWLRRARAVVAMTDGEAEALRAKGANAVRIANGVDTDFWVPRERPREKREERVLLNIAQLVEEHKRNSDLIRALVSLPAHWRLRLLGTGPSRPALESLAAELGVADRVAFLGMTFDRDEVRRHLHDADVFALPSAREGLPMALLEAMSCATPVVVSDIPANTGVVTHGRDGLVVGVGQPEALARAVQEAAGRGDLGPAARQTVEARFSERLRGAQLASVVTDSLRPAP